MVAGDYLDVASDEMSQTFSVLSQLPLASDEPTLRLRSPDLPPPPAAYLMELRSTRKPWVRCRPSGEVPMRYAERPYPE